MSRKLGEAEANVLRATLLKAFLLRAETCGWINSSGHLKLRANGKAQNFWMGVKVSLLARSETADLFNAEFWDRLVWSDPVVTVRGMHEELCLAMRRAVMLERMIALKTMIAAARIFHGPNDVAVLDVLVGAGAKVSLGEVTNTIRLAGVSASCTWSRNTGLVDGFAGDDAPLFAPGPGELQAWQGLLNRRPDLQPAILRTDDGMADRVDRTRGAGNGVCSLAAALAYSTLKAAFQHSGWRV